MSRRSRRPSWQEREAAQEAQKKIWATEVKEQQEWSAKPLAERVEDARYVLKWSPAIADVVLHGGIWMTDALRSCRGIEEAAMKAAADLHVDVEIVRQYLLLSDAEREEVKKLISCER